MVFSPDSGESSRTSIYGLEDVLIRFQDLAKSQHEDGACLSGVSTEERLYRRAGSL